MKDQKLIMHVGIRMYWTRPALLYTRHCTEKESTYKMLDRPKRQSETGYERME